MSFLDLPLETLPSIIRHIVRPHQLAQACLVNKNFYACAVRLLYERIAVFAWHREGKVKATQIFWTLANCPDLARYVRILELRDFPKAISSDSAYDLTQLCVSGLANCINLTTCTWTRDGSLKDDILEALSRCPSLEYLEINGRNEHSYDPSLLHKFGRLKKISVIMPSAGVIQALPGCFQRNLETLQELTIICKFTSVVTDAWLQSIAPSLCGIKRLHLAGCPKVSHRGIIDLLGANTIGLTDLALEAIDPCLDVKELARCASHALVKLSSITLTSRSVGVTPSWLSDVETLLFDTVALKQFHLYASGSQFKKTIALDAGFVKRFLERHKESLTRFAVLRLPVSTDTLEYIVRNGERLEQLFITIWRYSLNKLGPIVAQSTSLRALHVTHGYPHKGGVLTPNPHPNSERPADGGTVEDDDDGILSAHAENDARVATGTQKLNPLPSMAELEKIASQFGENIRQFGVQTRVWQVERIFTPEDDDPGLRPRRRVRLAPYEMPEVPDVFLVVRT